MRRPPDRPAGRRPDVTVIEQPGRREQAGEAANAYLLPAEPVTVVDPGPDRPDALEGLLQALAGHGLSPRDVRQILLTHGHPGHAGLAGRLQQQTGAVVRVHRSGLGAVLDPAADAAGHQRLVTRAAHVAAVPPEVLADYVRGWLGVAPPPTAVPATAVQPLDGGEQLSAGGAYWKVLHTPGHAPDGVCLCEPGSGATFVGDLFGRNAPTWAGLAPRRSDGRRPPVLAELVDSWRMLGRQAVAIAWPGHGPPVRAHRALLARRLAGTRSQLRATARAVAAGHATVWAIALAIGLPPEAEQLDRTLGQAIALLDWLVAHSWLSRTSSDGILRFAGPSSRPPDDWQAPGDRRGR
jgi:glyoxylase-like metal-dependent hydrolase (beta-lactamase superfamily II)